jgi:hypothetical protein
MNCLSIQREEILWTYIQRCQPSRPTAGDGGPSQFLPGRTGRRQNHPSRPSLSMTARRPGTCRGWHKPCPRQSSTVPGRHRAVRAYSWIKPNEALIACGKYINTVMHSIYVQNHCARAKVKINEVFAKMDELPAEQSAYQRPTKSLG